MLSHAHPWTGGCRSGGNSAAPIGRPLPSVHGRALGEKVALFLSTFVNKVDRKGRVSVPATFRAAVADQGYPGIVAFPSPRYDALEASGMKRMDEIIARMDALEEYSDEYEKLKTLFAEAHQLPFDTEGRIVLPENLIDYAHIGDSAAFVGVGRSFEIWEPAHYGDHRATLRDRTRQQGIRLPPLSGPAQRGRE